TLFPYTTLFRTPPAPFRGAEGDAEHRQVLQVAVYVYVNLAAIDEAESRRLGRKRRGGKEQQANEAHQYPHGHPSVTKTLNAIAMGILANCGGMSQAGEYPASR